MSSSNSSSRQPKKPDPVDAMLDEWRDLKSEPKDKHQPPALSQLELMLLLMKTVLLLLR